MPAIRYSRSGPSLPYFRLLIGWTALDLHRQSLIGSFRDPRSFLHAIFGRKVNSSNAEATCPFGFFPITTSSRFTSREIYCSLLLVSYSKSTARGSLLAPDSNHSHRPDASQWQLNMTQGVLGLCLIDWQLSMI